MIVDDTPVNLKLLDVLLRDSGYDVIAFSSGTDAIEGAKLSPPDIFLLDVSMPEIDGFEVCRRLKKEKALRDIPVLFISALAEAEDKIKAFDAGGVDYITKPFHVAEVKARVGTHLAMQSMRAELYRHNRNLEKMVEEKVREVYDSQLSTIIALAKLAEHRDNDTGRHLERVQLYTRILAEELRGQPGFDRPIDEQFIVNLYHAAPLHDIGKVSIPDAILLKPGPLSPDEFLVMKTHAAVGADTLQAVWTRYRANEFLSLGVDVTRSHHERWDGTGYPDGLAGEDIPLAGRIMAVADVYDALRTERVYKPAFPHEEARKIILDGGGTQFDPAVVQAFRAIESEFERISLELQ
jgi:putative two-component system response regulator